MNSPVIFITGAGKGIGKACVLEILNRATSLSGFQPKLFLTARTNADLEALQALAKKQGLQAEIFAGDLAQKPTAAIEACVRTFGRVDLCIHSAGVGRFGSFLEMTPEDVRFVTQTNVEASFLLMQAVYKQMAWQIQEQKSQKGEPQIQWITSVAAERPFAHSSIYCMSKYAQRGLLEVMRLYGYQDGVRILDIKPGAALTPMWGDVTPEMKSQMMSARDVAQAMIDSYFVPARASIETLTIRPVSGDLP